MESYTVEQLETIIPVLDTLYEQGLPCRNPLTNEVVSDSQYDDMMSLLAKLSPNSHVFGGTSASTVGITRHVKHNPPLTSIAKACHEDRAIQTDMLLEWIEKIKRLSGKGEINLAVAYKFDGVALGLDYVCGKLASAGLRSKEGTHGEDVLEQVKYIKSIPKELNEPVTCSVRGELVCLLSDFEKVQQRLRDAGEKVKANPRNHTAGAIRQFKDPSKTAMMMLTFIGYSIEGLDDYFDTELRRSVVALQLGINFASLEPYLGLEQLEEMEAKASMLPFEVDGIVISVNDLALQKSLGHSGDNPVRPPRGKIAWKFREEAKAVIIKDILFQKGRTGRVVPVACFDPIQLAGTSVSRVTLHNYGFMRRLGIGVGTEILVCKSGKIIPKVIDVLSGQYEGDPPYPEKCPETGVRYILTQREDGIAELTTETDDANTRVLELQYFLNVLQVKGIGKAAVEKLVSTGTVTSRPEFFSLNIQTLLNAGFTNRQAWRLLASLHFLNSNNTSEKIEQELSVKAITESNPKEITAWKFLASLGIPQVSESTSQSIFANFSNIEQVLNAEPEDFSVCDDVGEKIALALHGWLTENRQEIESLLPFFRLSYGGEGPLKGKTFVLTGSFPGGKQIWQSKIENLGGKCTSSVGRKVDYCVAGDNAGSKLQKANQLGVSVVSVEELAQILGK